MNFHLRPLIDALTAGSCARICFSACPSRRSRGPGEKSPILCLMGMFTQRRCCWIQAPVYRTATRNGVKIGVALPPSSISLIGCELSCVFETPAGCALYLTLKVAFDKRFVQTSLPKEHFGNTNPSLTQWAAPCSAECR